MSPIYRKMPYAERVNRRAKAKASFAASQAKDGPIELAFNYAPIVALGGIIASAAILVGLTM